ncbi:MAG: hypothetical protein ACOYXC_21820 [Candidatus Rifleibacteriota bacterium]
MKINQNFKIWILLVAGLVVSLPGFSYRPAPNPYSHCQAFLREKIINSIEALMMKKSQFPPPELRHDPETGKIPWEALQEQAMIEDIQKMPHWQKECQYAIAPWALKNYEQTGSLDECVYCVKHGFNKGEYSEVGRNEITSESIREYFYEKCRKYGLEPAKYADIAAGFDPDTYNIGHFSAGIRGIIWAANNYGVFPFIAGHLLAILLIVLLCWKVFFPGMDYASVTSAMGALWVGLHGFYLVIFGQFLLDGWGSRYIRFPEAILGYLCISSLLLVLFFIFMLMVFKKNEKPVAPIIGMLFATVPTVLLVNGLSSIVALWAFWRLCSDSNRSD